MRGKARNRKSRADCTVDYRFDRDFASVILASRSPRRRDLLSLLFSDFACLAADVDERPRPGEDPRACARRLAREKATSVQVRASARPLTRRDAGHLVIGADTVVERDGQILGKPADAEEARSMLASLSGRTHTVITAFALWRGGNEPLVREASTAVTFAPLSAGAIAAYVASGSPLDKAGAYGIQDPFGALFIERIEGDYNNVVGLPVAALRRALEELARRRPGNSDSV